MAAVSVTLTPLGSTGFEVHPLCLGGNVFGWTADEDGSFEVLDSYVEAGGNFIDTANQYSHWAPGNVGGESERIIGAWMARRRKRDEIVLATKVGGEMPGLPQDLRPATIARSIDESLARLRTDRIDLLYAHFDDPSTPLVDTLAAFGTAVEAGKVRRIGASNYSPARFEEALEISRREGVARFEVLQPHYNLVEREFERTSMPICLEHGIPAVPYFSLASGFLTGKYRGAVAKGPRSEEALAYADSRGTAVLAALDSVATGHDCAVAAVALAWLRAKTTVVAPIASARNRSQLRSLMAVAGLELTPAEVERLDRAGVAAR